MAKYSVALSRVLTVTRIQALTEDIEIEAASAEEAIERAQMMAVQKPDSAWETVQTQAPGVTWHKAMAEEVVDVQLTAQEDADDIAIARARLEEINLDPTKVVRGEELKKKLDMWDTDYMVSKSGSEGLVVGEDGQIKCVKCGAYSGDNWPCPGNACPIPISPHYVKGAR